jgi:MoaA/NifB/PqqE/SkfB family radical SAM enzyme
MSQLYSIHPIAAPADEASRIHQLPILLLNVHSNCNCRCVMCDIWRRKEQYELQHDDLERHRDSLKKLGVQHVVLTGGEPLLHSRLESLCDFFRQLDIRLTLLTTGLLLYKHATVVAEYFTDVIISIDGPGHIHDRIRRVRNAFALIERGIAEVRRLRPTVAINCRTTIQKLNHTHLRETVAAAKRLNFDSISFLAADLSSQAFNRDRPWEPERQGEVALTASELAALDREMISLIKERADDIDSGFIVESQAKLKLIVERFRAHLGLSRPAAPLCNAPWVSAVVEIDGSVRPCFFHGSVGNIKHQTLDQAINSPAALSFRGSLDIATNPTCQRCVCSLNYRPA